MNPSPVALLLLVAAVWCQAPPTPSWPTDFSSGFDAIHRHPTEVRTGRLFWSQSLKADRADYEVEGEHFFTEINTYTEGVRYVIQQDGRFGPRTCNVTMIGNTMPVPDFSHYVFNSQVNIHGELIDHWNYSTAASVFDYYDNDYTNDPVRWSRRQLNETQTEDTFWYEVDRGSQDPTLFNISLVAPGLCTNSTKSHHRRAPHVEPAVHVGVLPAVCDKAAAVAKQKCTCGCHYIYGGNSCLCGGDGGYDCSGLTYYAYRTAGWTGIARTALAQSEQGVACHAGCDPAHTANCRVGDLFFFNFGGGEIEHVVMYIGNDRIAECPHTGEDCHVVPPYMESYVKCRSPCS